MTSRPKLPEDFDESPELGPDFFASAKPALDDPDLARVLAAHSLQYREALRSILAAHEAGLPMDRALDEAKALFAAE